jgi:hypothetical protein
VVKIGADCEGPATDVMAINRLGDLADIANLGLTLAETKRLLAGLQQNQQLGPPPGYQGAG